jgi:hypothetical protein
MPRVKPVHASGKVKPQCPQKSSRIEAPRSIHESRCGHVVVDERQQRSQNRLLRDRAAHARDAAGRRTQGWKKVYLLSGHQ